MDYRLQTLQAQLADLQKATIPLTPITPTAPIVPETQAPSGETEADQALESLKKLIRDEVAAHFKGVKVQPVKTYTFIEAIEEVLSTSDQNFLSNITVVNALPAWIVSKGRDLTQQLVKEFRTAYES